MRVSGFCKERSLSERPQIYEAEAGQDCSISYFTLRKKYATLVFEFCDRVGALTMSGMDLLRSVIRATGYDLVRKQYAASLVRDLRQLVQVDQDAVFFDVGANTGQTVETIYRHFPLATVHAFEPSPSTFSQLQRNAAGRPRLTLNQCALGAAQTQMTLNENNQSDMSSLLDVAEEGWGEIVAQTLVEVDTVDHYCECAGIGSIDVLKIDAQGFDLEVLRGAEAMLTGGRVNVIWMELIFARHYVGQGEFGTILNHCLERGYRIVNFYAPSFRDGRLAWADGLFVKVAS